MRCAIVSCRRSRRVDVRGNAYLFHRKKRGNAAGGRALGGSVESEFAQAFHNGERNIYDVSEVPRQNVITHTFIFGDAKKAYKEGVLP